MENRDWSEFWREIPIATKIYSLIFFSLLILILILFIFKSIESPVNMPSVIEILPFFSSNEMVVPTPEAGSPMATSLDKSPIYSGPGETYPEIGALHKEQEVAIVGISPDGNWWALPIQSASLVYGWVSVGNVSSQNTEGVPVVRPDRGLPAESITTPTLDFEQNAPYALALNNIQIFFKPDLKSEVIGFLEAGERAEVVGQNDDGYWWAIRMPYVESGRAWVASEEISVVNAENVPIINVEDIASDNDLEIPENVPVVTAVANVNVRSGPGLGYRVISVLANGQTAQVLGKSQDGFWWVIKIPSTVNEQGWISVDYVIPRNTSEVPVIELRPEDGYLIIPSPVASAPYLETLVMVNIRKGPGVEYGVLARLEPGQRAEAVGISSNGSWYAIRVEGAEGGVGWVALVYVQAVGVDDLPILR